jgi:hypothetical protein
MSRLNRSLPSGFSQINDLILSSQHLHEMLLPEGPLRSPYEILDYDATLILHDQRGARATFLRTQEIRFLQDGVAGLLDHAWGDGVLVTNYRHSAGKLDDSFKDQGRRHLVVGLKRPMRSGEALTFTVEREVMEMFRKDEGWVETTIDHPVRKLRRQVIFPKSRPVQQAVLEQGKGELLLPIHYLSDGRTLLQLEVTNPQTHHPYKIRWVW